MMAKILIEHRPQAVIVAWDAGMSGREVITALQGPAPVAARPAAEQWPHLAPLAEAFGFHNVKVEGWEADDVIATLVRQAREAEIPVMVVSGDRDVYQLVGDGVRVMTTSRGVTETKVYDREGVVERYGVPPELVPDLIGLKGDTSDNIPGVPGSATRPPRSCCSEFGSLEAVLETVDKISGAKRKQNLTEHADDARVSKQLATWTTRSRCRSTSARRRAPSPTAAACARWRRSSSCGRWSNASTRSSCEDVPDRAVEETLWSRPRRGRRPISPTDRSRSPSRPGFGRPATAIAWSPATRGPGPLAEALRGRPLIAHDAKSQGGGGREGLLAVAPPGTLDLKHDTMVAAYLIDPARRVYDLNELAADAGLAAALRRERSPAQLSLAAEEGETAGDPTTEARLVIELAARQRSRLAEFGLERLLNDVEMPLIEVLAAMERAGVKLDAERLAEIGAGMADRIAQLESEIFELAGHEFTIGSPQQLGEVLFSELGLTKKRRGKTGFSTDARVLAQIRDEHEIVAKVEIWRELTKLKNTYLDALPELIDPETGRIHTTFNQVATTTGRLSSVNPNLQNIPIRSEIGRPVRACFVAERGKRLLSADYNQVELRVLAHVAGEDVLREIFASGEDVHATTAAEVLSIPPEEVGPARTLEGEDGQLRDRVRAVGVRACGSPADLPRGGCGLHPSLLRAVPGREALHRRDDRQGGA